MFGPTHPYLGATREYKSTMFSFCLLLSLTRDTLYKKIDAPLSCSPLSVMKIFGNAGSGSWEEGAINRAPTAACILAQTFSGLSGISMVLMPSGASASSTAFTTAGGAPMQPPSPIPFAPSGLMGEGVSTTPPIQEGICAMLGKV